MNERYELHQGDCLALLPTLAAESVHAVITDPPYHLAATRGGKTGFMGKEWDGGDIAFRTDVWREALRVLKPGGYLLAFGGTRTSHRIACAIEDAGFEIRDSIVWLYGSGFPKSLDVSKAIDREAGKEREIIGTHPDAAKRTGGTTTVSGWSTPSRCNDITAPATDEAKQWNGWGSALKPSHEPCIVARKPFSGTIAQNVLTHGTGAINIDGCRVGENPGYKYVADKNGTTFHGEQGARTKQSAAKKGADFIESTKGRFPANVIHDGSDEVLEAFAAFGESKSGSGSGSVNGALGQNQGWNAHRNKPQNHPGFQDSGSPTRFFYCAKASGEDRDGNNHPTVKPLSLMRYLCRLVCPPGGVILDPFMGSGSTGVSAMAEGFRFIGIEKEAEYFEICKRRLRHATRQEALEL